MNKAFLGLGGNLGDRLQNLYLVRKALNLSCGKLVKASGIYETAAWGYSSPKSYLNQVVELETPLEASLLLKAIREIEHENGRTRQDNNYQDRTVDIDLLFYNQELIEQDDLKVPHPRLAERRFVLQPLMDIAPDLIHPVLQKRVSELFDLCSDTSAVKLVLENKLPSYICIEGNIGSGKSTLARLLAPHLKAHYLPEKYEHLNLLPRFYTEPERFSFALEFAFLLNRFDQLSSHFQNTAERSVSDYSLYKSLYFARVNLKAELLLTFEKQFDLLCGELQAPGLIIHLNTGVEQLLKNIENRSRTFEKGITENYLRQVNSAYWSCFKELRHLPQLVIDIEQYHPELESEHLVRIDRFLVENFVDTM